MARTDLHVHSRHSDRPSEWFLKRIGAAESYTEPEVVYAAAKARGMDFVTLTDHNSINGAVALKRAHPHDVFVGVESTVYFPEDGCKFHLLIWGLDEAQFDRVQELREDAYALRDYLRAQSLAHSVAHATFAVNERLTVHHLEKLVVLFDCFEVVNGARTQRQNDLWCRALSSLTPESMARLAREHHIEPFGERPWIKGFTGGSDDHAGLLIGRTWTEAPASSPEEFLARVGARETRAEGRHNDYRTLAFSVYKIACDFSQAGRTPAARSLMSTVSQTLFAEAPAKVPGLSLKERVAVMRMRTTPLGAAVADLIEALRSQRASSLDERLDLAYDRMALVADELVLMLLESAKRHIEQGDVLALVRDVSAALPAAFVAAPFLTTMNALHRGRALADAIRERFAVGRLQRDRRTLWFSDTLDDLNGVSVTLRQLSHQARSRGRSLELVGCLGPGADDAGVLALPWMMETGLSFYEHQKVRVPSVLGALRLIQEYEPDEIVVSTPGPVGLTGLLAARLLDVPCRAVFHTDFGAQLARIGGDDAPVALVDAYVTWFYNQFDEVLATSSEYASLLRDRGIPAERIGLFRRGVDTRRFAPRPHARRMVRRFHGLGDGPIYLYAGRLSKDKDLDLLVDAHALVAREVPDATLVLAGDGPHADHLADRALSTPGVVLTGRLDQAELARLYAAVDFLVFPSVTDTFGMAVLEAQASGLPALVSASGGPKQVIVPGRSGFIVGDQSAVTWAEAIASLVQGVREGSETHRSLSAAARENALLYSWDEVFEQLKEPTGPGDCASGGNAVSGVGGKQTPELSSV
ncbi:MAG: glycosyltransferase [Coriobacteriia bacterium]|nr:glycosyltransferase [Coriobacteriia bacterium]